MLLPIVQFGKPQPRLGHCDACQDTVPLAQITGYPRNGGNTPLCPECALLVLCDCCREVVPLGLCEVTPDHEVTCHWCAQRPGFWAAPPAELMPAYVDPFAVRPDACDSMGKAA